MKHLILLLTVFTTTLCLAEQKELKIAILRADSIVADPSLDTNTMMHFNFPDASDMSSFTIQYSLDGVEGAYSLIDNVWLIIALIWGALLFLFFGFLCLRIKS